MKYALFVCPYLFLHYFDFNRRKYSLFFKSEITLSSFYVSNVYKLQTEIYCILMDSQFDFVEQRIIGQLLSISLKLVNNYGIECTIHK